MYGAEFELNWFLNGISLAFSWLVIGITHWLTGYYSDRINTRWGRRVPFIAVGTPAVAITGFLLFVPNWFIDFSNPTMQLALFGYYIVCLSLFKFSYAILMTAHQAWLPEITDEVERPAVSGMMNTFSFLANSAGAVLGFVLPLLFEDGPTRQLSGLGLNFLFAFCLMTVAFNLPAIALIRESTDIVKPKRSLRAETAIALKNRNFMGWALVVGLLTTSFVTITSQLVGFIQSVLLLTTIEGILQVALTNVVAILIFLVVWVYVMRRIGKQNSLTIGVVAVVSVILLTPIIQDIGYIFGFQLVGILFFIPMGAGMAVYYLMQYIVPADIAQVDTIQSGENRSGIFTGFIGVPLNIFQAAASLLLGWLMDYSVTTTGDTVMGLMWWGPMFAPFLLIGVFILRFIDIDPDFESLSAAE